MDAKYAEQHDLDIVSGQPRELRPPLLVQGLSMRRWLPWLCLGVALAATAPASAQGSGAALDRPRSGAEAVRALGDRLPAVAAAHDTTSGVLRERFETDPALWVDTTGRLFYIDPAAPDHVESAESTSLTTPLPAGTDAFTLHSRPGAQRTIHLDFDGHSALGAAWSPSYTGGDGIAEPYSSDADAGAFNDAELADIRSIWQRVAEDFAPFDVNVTTADPGFDAIDRSSTSDAQYGTRVVLTSSATECGCGGVAYVGVFDYTGGYGHAYYQPALVYNAGAKAAGEAASHEAGHNLGLSHDGTRQTGYYAGHGDWAPIMGVGYYEPISQWSRGEYSGANNKEDDFAVAGSNGAPLRVDDHGVGSGATPLLVPTDVAAGVTANGVIATAADVDELALEVGARATITIDVVPAVVSPNLDVRAVLRAAGGAEVASSDPLSSAVSSDVAAGLDASLTAQVDVGTYVLSLDGVGAHDPLSSGYSDYGSLGSYRVSVTTAAPDNSVVTPPTTPMSVTATAGSDSSVLVGWTSGGEEQTTFDVRREKYQRGGWSAPTVIGTGVLTTGYVDKPGAGTFRYSVRAGNSAGFSEWSAPSAEVSVAKTTGTKGNK